jgi:hypothetical protein
VTTLDMGNEGMTKTNLLAHLMGIACRSLEALALGYVDGTALAGPVLLL